jgi:methylmalonyl-CoA/ethylmalonyl-CoA epimerase
MGVFDRISQASIVVEDIFGSIKLYNDKYGIGPWIVLHFTQENTKNMEIRGAPEPFEMYLALCDSMNIQLELIQPISRNTTYYEFFEKHGPGIHHLCLGSEGGFQSIVDKLKEYGYGKLLGGTDSGGMEFCYVDMTDDLGFIVELVNPPDDFICPPPIYAYPEL